MPDCVIRFGGNNLKDRHVIGSFLKILKTSSQNHLIVVSAITEIQDILTKGLPLLSNGSFSHQEVIAELRSFLTALLQGYCQVVNKQVEKELSGLQTLLKGIEFTGDFSLSLQDFVISYSEKITSQLLLQVIEHEELEAILVQPDEIGLLVTEEYGNASILLEKSAKQIKSFQWKKTNLIPGSFGLSTSGKIARLGRRAADYTAASLAAILDTDRLELWQIGKAYKTADEKIVPNSKYIESLTYAEASELSYFSQSSVHPRIVEPLIEKHIPIHVFELVDGKKKLKTTINSKSIIAPQVVKSVAHSDEIAILKLNGPGVGFKPGILANITSTFNEHQINIRSVITAQTSINIIIDKASVPIVQRINQSINLPSVNKLTIDKEVSLIAIIGHGMQDNHGISAQLFTAVANNKINVLLSGSGASDLVSYLIVDDKHKNKAIQEIHKVFFHY